MSVKELAATMGVSLPKAYELAAQSNFPRINLGRRIVIPVEGFKHWLAAQSMTQGAGRVGVL